MTAPRETSRNIPQGHSCQHFPYERGTTVSAQAARTILAGAGRLADPFGRTTSGFSQSRPDAGFGFTAYILNTFRNVPISRGSGPLHILVSSQRHCPNDFCGVSYAHLISVSLSSQAPDPALIHSLGAGPSSSSSVLLSSLEL